MANDLFPGKGDSWYPGILTMFFCTAAVATGIFAMFAPNPEPETKPKAEAAESAPLKSASLAEQCRMLELKGYSANTTAAQQQDAEFVAKNCVLRY